MTRVIAGEFGGRRLTVPADDRVRPTADRVREAWFSILGVRVEGAAVVDLFAGSGALGIEALSRGARTATFVDLNQRSLAAIRANIAALGLADRTEVVRQDALRFVAGPPTVRFDLALADPPYGLGLAERLAQSFREAPFATLLCIEHRKTEPVNGDETRVYGDTAVTFLGGL